MALGLGNYVYWSSYNAGFTGLLDTYSGAAAAYSLRQLSSTYSGDAVRVRRSSDNTEQNIGFVSNELDTATLETFVKSGNVFANPDITSASSWTIGNSTTYNAATEAFDLSSENGLTVRQGKSVANHTYTITIVLGSVTSGGIKIYAGGTQSAVISTAGTHTLNITAGSSNDILGINPNGTATCSISSFYAVDTTADGFVAIWYDQSGNAVNAANTTAVSQPKIVSSGSTLLRGGKPSMQFDGNDDYFNTLQNNPFTFTGGISMIHASYKSASNYKEYETILSANGAGLGSQKMALGYSNASVANPKPTIATDVWAPSGIQYDGTVGTNERHLIGFYISNWSTHRSTGLSNLRFNGSDLITKTYGSANPTALGTNPIKIGVFFQSLGNSMFGGEIQEIIAYASDKNSDRVGIETNINDHYSIY